MLNRIVLDTNCLLASLSSKSENFRVWKDFQEGKFILCVSNEILEEYQEIIAKKTTPSIAQNVVRAIVESGNVEFIDPHFHVYAIFADPDDNKFVDCALAAGARFLISNDHHYDILKRIEYPKVDVLTITEFIALNNNKN